MQDTDKYEYLYIGGVIEGRKFPSIFKYLADSEIPIKKFIVVADSLLKLYWELGESMFSDYFFMVDEIDSYQYDSHYRPALEDVIDYYFLFPANKRCLVSATVGGFSNQKISDEPILNIGFNNEIPRDIDLIHTNNVIQATAEKIRNLLISNPDEKILVAFNALSKGIQKVIELLEPEIQSKCSIMCSAKNTLYIKDYLPIEAVKNKLPNQINFMTCTYFVGIDITERFHLISVCSANLQYSLLSEDKFIQILGRCRDAKGVFSESIIYNTKPVPNEAKDVMLYLRELEEFLLNDANLIIEYREKLQDIKQNYPQLINSYILPVNEYIKKSIKSYLWTRSTTLIRESIDQRIVPAYFNIDSIMIQVKLLFSLYSDKSNLRKKLIGQGNRVEYQERYFFRKESEDLQESPEYAEIRELEINDLIVKLRECDPEERFELVGRVKNRSSFNGTIFLERYSRLLKYVEFEELVEKLKLMIGSKTNQREYNKFYNSVIFWVLSDEHPLKKNIISYFKPGEKYTNKEIADKMKGIFANYFPPNDNLSDKSLIEKSSVFFSKKRIRERSEHKFRYKVLDFNINEFVNELLTIIASDVVASRYFRF